MPSASLIPDPASLTLDEIVPEDDGVTIVVHTTRATACCPDCGQPTGRLHSWYWRSVADLPWQGLAVRFRLHTRRWRCANPRCARRVFAERLPAVVARYARRTPRLAAVVEAIAFALGGEAGARLLAALGLPLSGDTLLRTIRATPDEMPVAPAVLGVDDFALRRGYRYGTLLVDLEARRPVDLLPEATSAGFAAWLAAHPGVAIICRDRGGAYAAGAAQGAPAAVQVADRFHLLQNLGDALERLLQRHHVALRETAQALTQAAREAAVASAAAPVARAAPDRPPRATAAQRDRARRRARRQARYEEVLTLSRRGVGVRAIARQLHMGRRTVRRFLAAGAFPERAPHRPRPSILVPYEADLRERWAAGCQNAAALWREIRARGFPGSRELVRQRVAAWRSAPGRPGRPRGQAAVGPQPERLALPPPVRTLSPGRAIWLLLRAEADLTAGQRRYRDELERRCPEAATARELAQAFRHLVRARDPAALVAWLAAAEAAPVPELREFAAGLRRDQAAVTAALEYAWSSGQVEGQITRLKLLKRLMYGRAKPDLRRRRVLRAA